MPTYEYRCRECGHEFELFQSMSDKPKRACPSCKQPKLERLIGTGAAVLFKGSGFYETDYRSESYKKAAEEEAKGGSTGETAGKDGNAKDAAKSEAGVKAEATVKPAVTTETKAKLGTVAARSSGKKSKKPRARGTR